MMRFKKAIIVTLIGLMCLTPTAVLAWQHIPTLLGIAIIIDAVVKTVKLMECDWKGRCQVKEGPAPGYGWENYRYWGENDLVAHFKEHAKDYGFLASNPPADAMASLPERTMGSPSAIYPAGVNAQENRKTLSFDKTVAQHWHKFDKGDLIFNDGTKFVCKVLEPISSWTHVGMIYDTSADNRRVFDSLPFSGVKIRKAIDSFGEAYAYSVKKVKGLSQGQIEAAMSLAEFGHADRTPYSPSWMWASIDRGVFAVKWAHRDDTSSLHCAKLVYHTFKEAGIDLDSNRTISRMLDSTVKQFSEATAKFIANAWIGLTPDDIYYSKNLGKDKYLTGRLRGMKDDFAEVKPQAI